MQRLRIRDRFGGAAHVRLGDDLQQRRAGAVQVDAGHALIVFMQRLAGIFFQMGARQLYGFQFRLAVLLEHERQCAALHYRTFELADLVALRQVRIEIILARKN